jgi:hypothetical protein
VLKRSCYFGKVDFNMSIVTRVIYFIDTKMNNLTSQIEQKIEQPKILIKK